MNALKMSSERCGECGAANMAEAELCWMCRGPLLVAAEIAPHRATPSATFRGGELAITTLLITIAVIAVLIGVYLQWPGVGFLLSIVMIPPLAATCIASFIRWAEGRPASAGSALTVFGATLGITVGIVLAVALLLVVIVVVCIAVLFAMCMSAAGGA